MKYDPAWRKVWSYLEDIAYSVSFLVDQGSSEPDTATSLTYMVPNINQTIYIA